MMETQSLMSHYQIEPYRGSVKKLQQIAVAFTGSPQASRDAEKVLLLSDPLSQHAFFYEFRASDIIYVEECPSPAMPDGSAVSMIRVWIKKGTTALKIVPFHVQDTSSTIREFF